MRPRPASQRRRRALPEPPRQSASQRSRAMSAPGEPVRRRAGRARRPNRARPCPRSSPANGRPRTADQRGTARTRPRHTTRCLQRAASRKAVPEDRSSHQEVRVAGACGFAAGRPVSGPRSVAKTPGSLEMAPGDSRRHAHSRVVYGSRAPKPRWSMRSTRASSGGWVLYSCARLADSLPSAVSFCSREYRASGFIPARDR